MAVCNGKLTEKASSRNTNVFKLVASVAQLVEQLTLNQLVLGSSPSRGTNKIKGFCNFSRCAIPHSLIHI